MGPEIYMSSLAREHCLARHDFYIEQVKVRVLQEQFFVRAEGAR